MIEDIKNIFNKTEDLKVLFFFNVNEEKLHEINEGDLNKIHHLHVDQNFIEVAVKLERELSKDKVLLTFPYSKPEGKAWTKFPLTGFYYANKELRLDEVGRFMDQYGLKNHQQKLVKQYQKELLTKKNQERLVSILSPDRFDEKSLKRGLISSLLDFSTVASEELILAKILTISPETDKLKAFINRIKKLELEDELLKYFRTYLNPDITDISAESVQLTGSKVKYNLITRFITKIHDSDTYRSLKYKNSILRNKFLSVIQAWQNHATLSKSFSKTIESIGEDIQADKIISWYGIDYDYGYYNNEMLNTITTHLLEDVLDKPSHVNKKIQPLLDQEITHDYHQVFHSIGFAAKMFIVLNAYSHYDYNRPEDYLYEYQNEWHKIDLNYRKFIEVFQRIPSEFTSLLDELYQQVTSKYVFYLKKLNISWQQLLSDKDIDLNTIKCDHQFNIYEKYIAPNTSKLAVIISDAFRYEVGKELSDILQQDTKNKVQLEIGMASIPSVTALGMTNLLPGKEIEVDQSFKITLGGQETSTTLKRSSILSSKSEKALAISYKDINRLSREEGRKLFNEHSPLYIYHNMIDSEGDKKLTEDRAFEAADRTISEIKRLIMKIYSWNTYHVLLTADHGFIYTHAPLKEDTLEDAPKGEHVVKLGSRYAIVDAENKDKTEGYRLKLKNTSRINSNMDIVLPRAVNRFRKAGSGNHFIHGGGNLQELLIPIMKYYRKKEGVSEQVQIKLLTQKLKTSGSLKLNFVQIEPVSDELKPLKVEVGLFDDTNTPVSNVESIAFDSTSSNPTDRAKSTILTLNNQGSKLGQCQLKVFEESDTNRLNPVLVKTVMIDTLMERDSFE